MIRAVKQAIAAALRADAEVAALVPDAHVFAVERATVPALPAVEVIGLASERVDTGPLVRHELAVEVTVLHTTEDGADEALDGIVAAIRARLARAEDGIDPIFMPTRATVLVTLGAVRWSVSAADAASVIRGASIGVQAETS